MNIRTDALHGGWSDDHAPHPARSAPQERLQRMLAAALSRSRRPTARRGTADPHPGDLNGDLFARDAVDSTALIETVMLERFSCVTLKRTDS